MALGSNTLDLIRQIFRKQEFERPPYVPPIGYQGLSSQQAFFGYGMPSEIQGMSDNLRIDSELVSRFVDYEDMDDAPLPSCLTGDTVVTTVAGQFTLKELTERYREGELFPILAFDIKRREFVIADAHHPRKTKTDKIIRVTFDDGSILRCTRDHKILSFAGDWVEAGNLAIGQSVMSCKMILNSKGYRELRQPGRKARALLYRLVANYAFERFDKKLQVHHLDEDKLNDDPENLQLVTREEHCRLHSPAGAEASKNLEWNEERRKKQALRMRGNQHRLGIKWTESEREKRKGRPYKARACSHVTPSQVLEEVRNSYFINEAAKNLGISWNSVCLILMRNGFEYKNELGKNKLNKKVIKIEDAGVEDVYDLTTEKYHNFVANNVVVHNSAYEIFTEDATQTDNENHVALWVECEDGEIKRDLDDLLGRRLKLEERVYEDVRTLVKYGNFYAEIVVKERAGVIALNSLAPPAVRRIEIPKEIGSLATPRIDMEADTMGFIYDPRGSFRITTTEFIQELNKRVQGGDSNKETKEETPASHAVVFEGWEVLHCRLRGKQPNSPYGFGVGEPARWIFKRLQLLEDSVMMHRLTRAPSRFAFYIDVSQIPPSETSGYLNRVKQALKKQKFTNPQTGKFDLKFSPLDNTDDFFLPVRDGKESTRVETLQGPVYDHIEDIRFFEEKLFAAFRIPRPFLTYENTTAKSHLSAEDARFARSVLRVQREYIQGIKRVCRIHLAAKGINPDTIDFNIKMTIPSAIFELSQLEIRNAELELAEKFGAWAPKHWIMRKILNFSDEEISEMNRLQKIEDEGGVEKPEGGGGGALERALSKRGTPAIESPPPRERSIPEPTPTPEVAWRTFKRNQILVNGKVASDRAVLDRIEELRSKNREFDRRLSESRNLLKEIRDRLK